MDGVDVAHTGGAVWLHGRNRQQGAVRLAVGKLHHGLCEILIALENIDVHRLPRRLDAVPYVGLVQIAGVQRDTAEHGIHVGKKPRQFPFGKLTAQVGDGLSRALALPACQKISRQQPVGSELDVRCAAAADVVHALHKGEHPRRDVLALFKLALRDGAVRKTHAVPPENGLHRDTHGAVEQVVLFAPRGKVLAAVHDAGQRAGDGEGRQRQLLICQQLEHRRDGVRQAFHAPLRQRDVQPCQTASCLPACGVLLAATLHELFQASVPALRPVIVRAQGAEHTHALHQRWGGEYFRLRQCAVVLLHLRVVPHAGMQLRIADQQLGDLGMVAAPGIAVQRAGEVLL